MENIFDKNPLKVRILDKDNNIYKTYTFIGKNTKSDYTNYKEKLGYKLVDSSKKYSFQLSSNHEVELVNNYVYPENNFEELREKIYLATDIKTYCQHLFYFDNDQIRTTYNIKLNGMFYTTNITKLFSFNDSKENNSRNLEINGIYIDKKFVSGQVKVEPNDMFKLITDIDNNEVFIKNLKDYNIDHSIVDDDYKFNLLYSGFIQKYYPRFSRDCFRTYLKDESSLPVIYPELMKSEIILKAQYEAEEKMLNYINSHENTIKSWTKNNIETYITSIKAQMISVLVQLNVRNIFDIIPLCDFDAKNTLKSQDIIDKNYNRSERNIPHKKESNKILEIRAHIMHEGRNYIVRKSHSNTFIKFPTEQSFSRDLIFAVKTYVNGQDHLLFVNVRVNGKVFVAAYWNETDMMSLDIAQKYCIGAINTVCEKINKLGHIAFIIGIEIPNAENNLTLSLVEYNILWKKSMNNLTFNTFIKKFEELHNSSIIEFKQSTQLEHEHDYLFHKGAHNFNIINIESILENINVDTQNLYSYLTDVIVAKKWKQIYGGRLLYISHKTTSIALTINSIGITEYDIFFKIISGFIYQVSKQINFNTSNVISVNEHFYKTRKLRQEDPELYDLKRYDSRQSDNVYARYCQQNRQPIIYSDNELAQMSATKRANLIKYWNFTKKKPAFYSCPNPDYPVLSFIVGKHPRNYCLPCCTKISNAANKDEKITSCITNLEYNATVVKTTRLVEFGKKIESGRLTHPPREISKLLYNMPTYSLCVVGQQQIYHSIRCGSLYSLSYLLGINTNEIIKEISTLLNSDKLFDTLLGGAITIYFTSYDEFKHTFNDIFILNKISIKEFDWNILIAELIGLVYGLDIFMFSISLHDKSNKIELSQIKNSMLNEIKQTYILINYKKTVNPMIDTPLDNNVFIRGNTFINQQISTKLRSIVQVQMNNIKIPKNYVEIAQYINKAGLCYARIYENLTGKTGYKVYIPVINESINRGIPAIYDNFNSTGFTYDALIDFFGNEFINKTLLQYNGKVIAIKSSIGVHHIEPIEIFIDSIPTKVIKYDPLEVNKAILSNAPSTKLSIGEALYTNYQYRLFVIEFANYIDNERNDTLRNKIYTAIRESDLKKKVEELKKQVRSILHEHNADMQQIINQIMVFFYRKISKENLIAQIKNTIYKFDRMTLNRIFTMEHDEIVKLLHEISPKFAIEQKNNIHNFTNVYVACKDMINKAEYCVGDKLMVTSMEEMIKFLADDLSNELKRQYMLTNIWVDNYIDFFSFTARKNEKIQIFQ